tara:strand:- start:171 stop:449 length:279 start_codon:yes stop_codon:yes gene_type:complete
MLNEKGSLTTPLEIIRSHSYPLLAAVSTVTFVIASFSLLEASKSLKKTAQSLEPVSAWAKTQNDCIERTFRINGKDTRGLSSKVWSCNGGGD